MPKKTVFEQISQVVEDLLNNSTCWELFHVSPSFRVAIETRFMEWKLSYLLHAQPHSLFNFMNDQEISVQREESIEHYTVKRSKMPSIQLLSERWFDIYFLSKRFIFVECEIERLSKYMQMEFFEKGEITKEKNISSENFFKTQIYGIN